MQILLTSHYFPPHMGGIERVVWHEAEELAQRGHRVRVITSSVGYDGRAPKGVEVTSVRSINPTEYSLGVPFPVLSIRDSRKAFEDAASFDVVHAHGLLYQASISSAFVARRTGVPLVVTEHVGEVDLPGSIRRATQALAFRTIGRYVARAASAIVALNARVREEVMSATGRPSEILANGIDTSRFAPVSQPRQRSLPMEAT